MPINNLQGLYRKLPFRVKHPIAQVIRKVKGLGDKHLSYEHWIERVEQRAYNPVEINQDINGFQYQPKISIITPVYNTPPAILDLAIHSVQKQHYENWELCICDDASSDPGVPACLEKWQKQDSRIKVALSPENEGISCASNRALQLASGEFVGFLDHDDELTPDALYEVVKLLQDHPEADMIYSDEDRLDADGRRVQPFFKPDWSPENMFTYMYTCHFGVYRRRLVNEIGGFRRAFDGSQDYDLVLRLSERTKNIHHVPKILYRWRMVPSSAAASSDAKPYAYEAAKKALSEHLNYRQIHGEILDGTVCSHYRIRFNIPHTEKVSIIIANTAKFELLQKCIGSIETNTSYPNYEVIVVDNEALEPASREYLLSRSHSVVTYKGSGNSAQIINFGSRHATGNYLLLLHGDTEVISPDWITSMLGFCRLSEIGAVGAKLIDRNGRIQQAGLVLGLKGVAGYPLRKSPRDTPANNNFVASVRNCSAVSGVCMMVRKSVFEQVGGFDENLSSAYNDVDFCLKVRESGYRIVWTPWAELYHEDDKHSERRANSRELAYLKKRWGKTLMKDPYYNPNLTLRHEDLGYRV